mgnify:CR=1 FL=1
MSMLGDGQITRASGKPGHLPITPMFVKTGNTLPQLRLPSSAHRWNRRRGEYAKKVVTNLKSRALTIWTRAMELILRPWSKK